MGLLEASRLFERDDIPDDIKAELAKCRREVARILDEKQQLAGNVRNLLHFIEDQNRRKRDLRNRIIISARTGLPNHEKLEEDLVPLFNGFNEIKDPPNIGVIILKLDSNFDMINKTLKPSMSEWVLYQIGQRIVDLVGRETPVYHTREDEFIVIIINCDSKQELARTARNLSTEVRRPQVFSGYHISIGCAIGIALFPENGLSKSLVLHNADIALAVAERIKKPFVFYAESMREQVVERMELQNSIIRALEEQSIKEIDKQFRVYYQAIVEVSRRKDGGYDVATVEAEALIRWHHPTKGLVEPLKFIPIAEETGLILPIGNWVLYTVAAHVKGWMETGLAMCVSVNLSPRQFRDEQFVSLVTRAVKHRGLDPRMIRLELTENSFMEDPMNGIRKMEQLREVGLRFSIDDFGAGYSSLNYLRRLPVSEVKIDKSFIKNIVGSKQDQAVVRAIVALSKELGFNLVAEGVETQEQLDFLYDEGCRRFQGYYFSKPLPRKAFQTYCATHSARCAGV